MKLIDWLKDGGGKFIGFDNDNEPVYSVSNGETLMFMAIIAACTAGAVAVLAWRLWL